MGAFGDNFRLLGNISSAVTSESGAIGAANVAGKLSNLSKFAQGAGAALGAVSIVLESFAIYSNESDFEKRKK